MQTISVNKLIRHIPLMVMLLFFAINKGFTQNRISVRNEPAAVFISGQFEGMISRSKIATVEGLQLLPEGAGAILEYQVHFSTGTYLYSTKYKGSLLNKELKERINKIPNGYHIVFDHIVAVLKQDTVTLNNIVLKLTDADVSQHPVKKFCISTLKNGRNELQKSEAGLIDSLRGNYFGRKLIPYSCVISYSNKGKIEEKKVIFENGSADISSIVDAIKINSWIFLTETLYRLDGKIIKGTPLKIKLIK